MKKTLLWMGLFYTGFAFAQQPVVVPPPPTTTTTTTTTTQQQQQQQQIVQPVDTVVVREQPPVVQQDTVYVAEKPGKERNNDDFDRAYIGGRVLATVTDVDYRKFDNGAVETEIIWGYGVGGFVGVNFTPNLALQLEVLYQSLAQRVKFNNVDHRLNLRYLNIPLLLVLNTDIRKPVNLNICAGPQIGIRMGAEIDEEDGAGSAPDTVQAAIAVKPGDLGLAYGAGLDFNVSSTVKLGIGFRGVLGIIDIDENSQNSTTNNFYVLDRSKLKTYSGYLGLRVSF
jgi:hypothetical protein